MLFRITTLALVGSAMASPIASDLPLKRASCPDIHVFGARETTASPGYGSSATVVDDILNGYPGSTAEAINYPACGGQSTCGGDSYSQSVQAGFAAAASAVNSFNSQCPDTQLVLVGYSQVCHLVLLFRPIETFINAVIEIATFGNILLTAYREVRFLIQPSVVVETPTRATQILQFCSPALQ